MSERPTTCVVGAGPSGLALARAFRDRGLPVEVLERHDRVGGIWDPENPGSPIYASAHFISSKTQSAFPGFPMPDDYPDYPSHRQILRYLEDFADAYGLHEVIRLGCGVESANWDGTHWQVRRDDGTTGVFDHLVCASGSQWTPRLPDIPGEFDGELLHSNAYWDTDRFKGRRVLVIGAGNSGVDIACDAAVSADHAVISMRRGYHVIPKHIFGMPADVFAQTGPELPMPIAQRVFPFLLRLLHGRPERYGLPTPDHRLFESHPIVNTAVLGHLSHGDLAVRPDVRRFEGSTVHFADGSSDTFDVVVYATGFRIEVPYLDVDAFDWHHDKPQLYLHLFSRRHERLHAMGFVEGDGGGYPIFGEMAALIADVVGTIGTGAAPPAWQRQLRDDDPDLVGGVRHVPSPRHANYLHMPAYRKHLARVRSSFGFAEPPSAAPESRPSSVG